MTHNSKSQLPLLPNPPQPIASLSFRKPPSPISSFYPCGPNMVMAGTTQGALAPRS